MRLFSPAICSEKILKIHSTLSRINTYTTKACLCAFLTTPFDVARTRILLPAGWFERTVFLGVGRAWFDPLKVIGYLGIRDALLLKLFD